MGTQWFRGQLGLNLQRRLIRHSENWEGQGLAGGGGDGVVPARTASAQTRSQRGTRARCLGKSRTAFLKGSLLSYTVALPEDSRVSYRIGGH